ncbi:MAG: hypothetical protein U9Q87_05295 [Pseudomonadota bacterium]|nr:hypothetical protein [Pseudomonadota bacterium]
MKHIFQLNGTGVSALAKVIGSNLPVQFSVDEVRQLENLAIQLERAEALEETSKKDWANAI